MDANPIYSLEQVREIYVKLGAKFILPLSEMVVKLSKIRAFIYDWDGVFNDGTKGEHQGSTYKEADSMGTNLLRFAYWLAHGETLPKFGIITGAKNMTALELAKREHFDCIYLGTANKAKALAHFTKEFGVPADQVAFFFDDVLDLPIAEKAGLRFQVRRPSSPLFTHFAHNNHFTDYLTANAGDAFAVRETAELIIALLGKYEDVLNLRMKYEGPYQRYLGERNAGEVNIFNPDDV